LTSQFDRAVSATMCQALGTAGSGLMNAGIWLAATGVGVKPAVGAFGLGAAATMAHQYNCNPGWDPEGDTDWGSTGNIDGCKKIANGYGQLQLTTLSGDWANVDPFQAPGADRCIELIEMTWEQQGDGRCTRTILYLHEGGMGRYSERDLGCDAEEWQKMRINPTTGTCDETVRPTPEGPRPYEYTDPETDCTLTVNWVGTVQNAFGGAQPVFHIAPSENTGTRAGGGRISACNFQPIIYVGGPGGPGGPNPPPPPIPFPPELPPIPWDYNDIPDWIKPIIQGTIAGSASFFTQQILQQLFEKKLPLAQYRLRAVCDYDENGNIADALWTVPEQSLMDRLLGWQEAHNAFRQAAVDFKTPICAPDPGPELFLHWRSITFESDDYTETGNSRLVKRFRYRGSSPGDVKQLAEHWKSFEWDTGGVIVKHEGSAVGTPQVWAASVDEGKRVIRHAFGEAGLDPDQVGEWRVSSSDNPRYGVSRRVKLKTIDGCWMATARSGPSGWPEAAVCSPDPGVPT